MKPILNVRTGTLSVNGSRFLAPRILSTEHEYPTVGLEVSPPGNDWNEFLAKVDRTCKSGSCQCALRPRCKGVKIPGITVPGIKIPQLCGCGGSGHRKAMLRKYHDITEYLEEHGDGSPSSTPILVAS